LSLHVTGTGNTYVDIRDVLIKSQRVLSDIIERYAPSPPKRSEVRVPFKYAAIIIESDRSARIPFVVKYVNSGRNESRISVDFDDFAVDRIIIDSHDSAVTRVCLYSVQEGSGSSGVVSCEEGGLGLALIALPRIREFIDGATIKVVGDERAREWLGGFIEALEVAYASINEAAAAVSDLFATWIKVVSISATFRKIANGKGIAVISFDKRNSALTIAVDTGGNLLKIQYGVDNRGRKVLDMTSDVNSHSVALEILSGIAGGHLLNKVKEAVLTYNAAYIAALIVNSIAKL